MALRVILEEPLNVGPFRRIGDLLPSRKLARVNLLDERAEDVGRLSLVLDAIPVLVRDLTGNGNGIIACQSPDAVGNGGRFGALAALDVDP